MGITLRAEGIPADNATVRRVGSDISYPLLDSILGRGRSNDSPELTELITHLLS